MDQQQVVALKADGNSVITKANALIEASYNLTLNEQRIVLACAAKLDGRKLIPKDAVFVLGVDKFITLFNSDPKNAYAEMEEAATRLYERDIRRIEGNTRKRLRWVYMAEYRKGEGKVRLGFSPEIAPYLTMLHQCFTSYRLQEVASLSSAYAIRLFEMLAQFSETGLFVISVADFKHRLGLDEKYDRFSNLKARVIEPAVNDLVAKTSLNVSWQALKKGKTVERIEFRFSEKQKLALPLREELVRRLQVIQIKALRVREALLNKADQRLVQDLLIAGSDDLEDAVARFGRRL
jgi:plasmid replication initiation protein